MPLDPTDPNALFQACADGIIFWWVGLGVLELCVRLYRVGWVGGWMVGWVGACVRRCRTQRRSSLNFLCLSLANQPPIKQEFFEFLVFITSESTPHSNTTQTHTRSKLINLASPGTVDERAVNVPKPQPRGQQQALSFYHKVGGNNGTFPV